jgi:hypothetical protein
MADNTTPQGGPAASGPTPPPPWPAIQLTVNGDGNRITITTPGTSPGNGKTGGTRPPAWRRARAIIVDLAIIAGAIATILSLLL